VPDAGQVHGERGAPTTRSEDRNLLNENLLADRANPRFP
jgi:hypothetical protein